ncbi:putative class B secretin-like G-protein coupled receptor GPRcal2 [Penaeus vannamei]|uniref:Putative class B secretin-like G-protein coupled receptor GPRcal2 n=1 Tax=Penaeus vannamei TaxID=6689 RepID=A0A3R7MBJ1_PENVA|nr:putative class B secretin-like G-protein coupled receptor GPRcal2 [Penaeus vannamei]
MITRRISLVPEGLWNSSDWHWAGGIGTGRRDWHRAEGNGGPRRFLPYLPFDDDACWWGYNLSPYFWILEGPRLTVIVTNLLFLLNILRVLITKLQATLSSETHQIK